MHLVLLHGYLLRGTGSNIYSINVANTWKKAGHSVTIVCQDRKACDLECVDEYFDGTNIPSSVPLPGTIRVVVPDIDGLLLVYVFNEYEGFSVKELGDPACSIAEIDNHIDKTVAALIKVLSQGVDRILSNHVLLSPVIAKRASEVFGVPYDIKIHGSALNFSLKKRPELMRYALEGFSKCDKIIAATRYIVKLLEETFGHMEGGDKLTRKIVIIPPGMDPDTFQLLSDNNQKNFLSNIQQSLLSNSQGRHNLKVQLPTDPTSISHDSLVSLAGTYDQWTVDSDLLDKWPQLSDGEPIICYFGAFLDKKGVGEVLVSFIKILNQIPTARLLIMGYGGYREHMEGMIASLVAGNLSSFIAYSQAGDFLDADAELLSKLFRQISHAERQRITITGMLNHKQLREILPLVSVSIVSSKCSESFGMVLVEAMASGVLPVANYHSGIKDVLDTVKTKDADLEAKMHMAVTPGGKYGEADGVQMLEIIPQCVIMALEFLYPNGYNDNSQKLKVGKALRDISVEHFSWSKICQSLLLPSTCNDQ